jgi:hypothetical protein
MELYLQYGWGMKEHTNTLLKKWNGGTVILSPRDIEQDKLVEYSNEFKKNKGTILFDPQLYNPRASHDRLTNYDYWPADYSTNVLTDQRSLSSLLKKIKNINDSIDTESFILPGLYCSKAKDDWFTIQKMIINEACRIEPDKNKLATICLSSDTMRSEEQLEHILLETEGWSVDGYYVIPEHPNGQYLVDDPVWLSGLIELCAGLKLQNKKVIVGYSNHQFLCLSTANIDAIASGSWLNVRTFTSSRFDNPAPDEQSRKSTWYYCPQSLSEYKINFLNMAQRNNILMHMAPDRSLNSDYANILFSGAQPTDTSFKEGLAFRHYLDCLYQQCKFSHRATFKDTVASQEILLNTAERFINLFHKNGVRGLNRDFYEYIDINRSALSYLEQKRGFVLEREWN